MDQNTLEKYGYDLKNKIETFYIKQLFKNQPNGFRDYMFTSDFAKWDFSFVNPKGVKCLGEAKVRSCEFEKYPSVLLERTKLESLQSTRLPLIYVNFYPKSDKITIHNISNLNPVYSLMDLPRSAWNKKRGRKEKYATFLPLIDAKVLNVKFEVPSLQTFYSDKFISLLTETDKTYLIDIINQNLKNESPQKPAVDPEVPLF